MSCSRISSNHAADLLVSSSVRLLPRNLRFARSVWLLLRNLRFASSQSVANPKTLLRFDLLLLFVFLHEFVIVAIIAVFIGWKCFLSFNGFFIYTKSSDLKAMSRLGTNRNLQSHFSQSKEFHLFGCIIIPSIQRSGSASQASIQGT